MNIFDKIKLKLFGPKALLKSSRMVKFKDGRTGIIVRMKNYLAIYTPHVYDRYYFILDRFDTNLYKCDVSDKRIDDEYRIDEIYDYPEYSDGVDSLRCRRLLWERFPTDKIKNIPTETLIQELKHRGKFKE